jgi:RecB family exonuclease
MSARTTEPADFVSLYHRAFTEYGTQALWNKRRFEEPTPEDALVVARALRIAGDREARLLAEQIEQACHAAL